MLNLESRMEILGVTVFQDADRPNQFYHLPGPPKLTREGGRPLFDLFTFRRGGVAGSTISGGFLNMTVDVGLGSLKTRIERRLQEQFGGNITLAPVPYIQGSAKVIALGEESQWKEDALGSSESSSVVSQGPRFIEKILGSGRPSLDGDNRTIFSFSLNEDGAAFFMQVLNGSVDARPVGVVYELDYVGLLPAYDLEIDIDFKSCYEYLRSRFTLGTLFFKMDVDDIVEELERSEAIKVREVARTLELSSPEAMRERQERIDNLVKDLATGALFSPTLVPGEPKVPDDTITATDPTTAFRDTDTGPLGWAGSSSDSDRTGGSTRPAAASRALDQGPSAAVAAGLGQTVGARENAAEARASSSPENGGSGTDEGGASDDRSDQRSGGNDDTDEATSDRTGGSDESGRSDGSGGAQQDASGRADGGDGNQQDASGRTGDSGRDSDNSRDGGANNDRSGNNSRGGDSSQDRASAQSDRPSGSGETPSAAQLWNFLGRPQAAFVYKQIRQEEQRTVTYRLNQTSAQKQTVAPQNFIQFMAAPHEMNQRVHAVDLNHPFFQRLNININAADVDFDAEGIAQMTVQIRYGTRPDGTGPKDTAEVILRSPQDSMDFTFFTDEKGTLSYEYKLIVDYRSRYGIGVQDPRVEGDWVETEARSLSVRPSWLGRTRRVQLQLAPNLPPDVTEVHARVRYTYEEKGIDDATTVRLNSHNPTGAVTLRMDEDMQSFTVQSTLYYSDGTREELPPSTLPDPSSGAVDDVVVINAPLAHWFTADVIMLDPMDELRSVLVDAQVRQNDRLVDSRTLELETPGERKVISVRLPQREEPASFRYRERRLYKDGGFEEAEWIEAPSTNLLVGVPAGGIHKVAVNYIGPAPSALGLSAIILDLEYSDPNGDPGFEQYGSLLITDDPDSHIQEWAFRMADRQSRAYRWQMTLMHFDGSDSMTEKTEDTRDRLIIRVPQL